MDEREHPQITGKRGQDFLGLSSGAEIALREQLSL
jgi:hypothetical protein